MFASLVSSPSFLEMATLFFRRDPFHAVHIRLFSPIYRCNQAKPITESHFAVCYDYPKDGHMVQPEQNSPWEISIRSTEKYTLFSLGLGK